MNITIDQFIFGKNKLYDYSTLDNMILNCGFKRNFNDIT